MTDHLHVLLAAVFLVLALVLMVLPHPPVEDVHSGEVTHAVLLNGDGRP